MVYLVDLAAVPVALRGLVGPGQQVHQVKVLTVDLQVLQAYPVEAVGPVPLEQQQSHLNLEMVV
jgi:hypothetical protein